MPAIGKSSSSSSAAMPMIGLLGLSQYQDLLRQKLLEAPGVTNVWPRDKLIQTYGVSYLERTMQSWLERERASAPQRAVKRGSSDLPMLDNLEAHGDYIRGLLVGDPAFG